MKYGASMRGKLCAIAVGLALTGTCLLAVHFSVSPFVLSAPAKSDVFFISNTQTCRHWIAPGERPIVASSGVLANAEAESLCDLAIKFAMDPSCGTNSVMAYDCLENAAKMGYGKAQFLLAVLWDFGSSAFPLGIIDPKVDSRLAGFQSVFFCSDHNAVQARDIAVVKRKGEIISSLVDGDAARIALFWYRSAVANGLCAAEPFMMDLSNKMSQERERYLGKMKKEAAVYSACWLRNRDPLHKHCRCRCPTVQKWPKKMRAKIPCSCPRYNDAALAMEILERASRDGDGPARLARAVAEEILMDPLYSVRDATFKEAVKRFYGDARTLCQFAYPKGSITNSQVVAYVTSLYRNAIAAGDTNAPVQLTRFRKRVAAARPVRPPTFREKVACMEKEYEKKVANVDTLPEWQRFEQTLKQLPAAVTNTESECSGYMNRLLTELSRLGDDVPKYFAFGRMKKAVFGLSIDSDSPETRKRNFNNWLHAAMRINFAAQTCLPPCRNSDYRWRLEELRCEIEVLENAYLRLRRLETRYGRAKDVEKMRTAVDVFCARFFVDESSIGALFGPTLYGIFICQLPYPLRREVVDRLERTTGRKWHEPKIRHWHRIMGMHGLVRPKEIYALMESDAESEEIFASLGRIIDDLWAADRIDAVSKKEMQKMILETIARNGTVFTDSTDALDLLASCSVLVECADFGVCLEDPEALICFGRYLANCSESRSMAGGKVDVQTPITLSGHRRWLLEMLAKPLDGFAQNNGKEAMERLLEGLEETADLSYEELRDLKQKIRQMHLECPFVWLL